MEVCFFTVTERNFHRETSESFLNRTVLSSTVAKLIVMINQSGNMASTASKVYEEYVSSDEMNVGLESGQFVQGKLVISSADQAYIRVKGQV